jgi:capsular polysaccharide biosynthesis protein
MTPTSAPLQVKKLWRLIFWRLIAPSQSNFRKLLVFLLAKNPVHISSAFWGPPKTIYPCTKNWVASQKQNRIFKYKEIESAQIVCKKSPKSLDDTVHWEFIKWQTIESPTLFVLELFNGRVVGEGRAVITPDDCILGDLSPEYKSDPHEHSLLSSLKLPALTKTDQPMTVLANVGGSNYYHWLFDVLPRLYVLEKAGFDLLQIDSFLFNKISQPFQVETLTALGIERQKIVEAHEDYHLQSERLIVPSLTGQIGHPSNWACQFLRDRFLKKSNEIEQCSYLYISRGKATRRRVLNEIEVSHVLEENGFKVVHFEDFSFFEQVELISSASVVVAPHGAALANLVFCAPQTKVIEIFAPKYVNQCYLALAHQVNLDYYYLLGEGEKLAEGTFEPIYVEEDITVNIEALTRLLNLSGIKIY